MDLVELVLGIKGTPDALNAIRTIVKNNPEELTRPVGGITALMLACQNSNSRSSLECVKLLIEL